MAVERIHPVARGFAAATEAYERGRPGYPPEAIAFLVRELGIKASSTVLDVGAGTGKLTEALVPTGASMIALEPVQAMGRALAAKLPDVAVLDGTAEAIPLPDGEVDAIVVGTAFHWFDGRAALAEFHRVLRADSLIALLWNVRDDSLDWVARLNDIVDAHDPGRPRYRSGTWRTAFASTGLFAPLEERRFQNPHHADSEGIVARVASIAFIASLSEERGTAVLEAVRDLLRTHPDTRGRDEIVLPYRTDLFYAKRRSAR